VRTFAIALGLASTLLAASQVAAQQRPPRSPTQFGEADPVVLSPDRAYIFYRTPVRETYRFLREVTAEERAEHAASRAEALGKEHARYVRRLASWERASRQCAGGSETQCSREARPVEPTDDNFAFPPPEADNFAGNANRPRIMNDGAWSAWLIAVEPGTYSLYGAIIIGTNGLMGTCFCMGSIRFDAPAGQITDIGEIQLIPEDQRGDPNVERFRLGHFGTVVPPSDTLRRPPQFANVRVVPAQLRAADKMPNYFGVSISRLAPIPGILDYRRDIVLDGRTGQPVAQGEAGSGGQ
jgi:hypothetical protein